MTQGLADEYLHLMARNNELLNVFESLALDVANAEVLTHPVRQVRPEVLRPLMRAARQQKRLDVDYVSVNHPDREGRIIVPHTVVYTGLRWHVRGWCEKNQAYRDFVLSRFRGEPEIMDQSEHGIEGDTEWNLKITIRIAADQRLTVAQREVVEVDYGMQNGVLEIPTRARLVTYVLQLLNIKPAAIADDPTAQQIVVAKQGGTGALAFRLVAKPEGEKSGRAPDQHAWSSESLAVQPTINIHQQSLRCRRTIARNSAVDIPALAKIMHITMIW